MVSTEPESENTKKAFLSLSVDVSGSTYAKQQIIANSEQAPEHRVELYEKFVHLLTHIEGTLYDLLSHSSFATLTDLFQ